MDDLLKRLQALSERKQGGAWPLIVAIVAMAAWSIVSWLRARELARLRHEAFVRKLEAEQAALDAQRTDVQSADAASTATVSESKTQVEALDAQIKLQEQKYAADLQAIRRIRSWRDVAPGAGR